MKCIWKMLIAGIIGLTASFCSTFAQHGHTLGGHSVGRPAAAHAPSRHLRIWVAYDGGEWVEYRDKDLVLVDEAYQADAPEGSLIQLGT
ncbi:MAG: hypothetical protein ACJ8F7_21975 [Gemmataceae bacterium]